MLGQVTVIGCGLIGGSLIKSLRAKGGAARLSAVDHASVLAAVGPFVDEAVEASSELAGDLVAASDVVVLAIPIGAILTSLPWVLDAVRSDAVVTDTGSVKKPVLSVARAHPRSSLFVAGHPMAGREIGGFEAASVDLFERAKWFLVGDTGAQGGAESKALLRVAELARAVGAEPTPIDADAHDRAMAYVSHAPQLVASAVYSIAARAGVIGEAGPGFRDVTRISGGPASIWRDIFESNRRHLADALGEILEPLVEVRRLLASDDENAMAAAVALLEQAHDAKSQIWLSARPKGES